MVAIPIPQLERSPLTGEQRVTFRGLNWQSYQQILQALPHRRTARIVYDCGTLEITMPLEDHEFALRLIELFIRILVLEMGLKLKTMGSTTMSRQLLDRGTEPDCAYYIQKQPLVAGRTVDFETDPPPDLVVEVDITHSDIDKNRLYSALGVPEFWRYNGETWRIYQLREGVYEECEQSPTFPWVSKKDLYTFLKNAYQDEIEAETAFRSYVKTRLQEVEHG